MLVCVVMREGEVRGPGLDGIFATGTRVDDRRHRATFVIGRCGAAIGRARCHPAVRRVAGGEATGGGPDGPEQP